MWGEQRMDAFIEYLEIFNEEEKPKVTKEKLRKVTEDTVEWMRKYFSGDTPFIAMKSKSGKIDTITLKKFSLNMVDRCESLIINKNKDYSGGEDSAIRNFEFGERIINVDTEKAIMSRIMDKLSRINGLSQKLFLDSLGVIKNEEDREAVRNIKSYIDEYILYLLWSMKKFSKYNTYNDNIIYECICNSILLGAACRAIKSLAYAGREEDVIVGQIEEKIEDTCIDSANYFILLISVISK